MRAEHILRQVLGTAATEIHRARLKALSVVALALVSGGEVGLSALGHAVSERSPKHGIKRVDRLLGNPSLHRELDAIYQAIARYVLRGEKRPVILLDWTEAGDAMCALTAAVPMKGRALAIYSVTVPTSQFASRVIEDRFLGTLRTLLPPTCKPILVGDAGFRAPWIRHVHALGWDFVTRVRGRTQVQRVGEDGWQHWKDLPTRRAAQALGHYRIAKSSGVEAQLVVVDGRSHRARTSVRKRRSARALRASKAQCEPWCLATSLTIPPKAIIAIYRLRMQIELTFRDLKSRRFGWGLEHARCRSTSRVAVQLLLAALASLVVMLFGIAAEATALQKRFQANTTTKRRVLSVVRLGRAVLKLPDTAAVLAPPRLIEHLAFVGIP